VAPFLLVSKVLGWTVYEKSIIEIEEFLPSSQYPSELNTFPLATTMLKLGPGWLAVVADHWFCCISKMSARTPAPIERRCVVVSRGASLVSLDDVNVEK
jgi:hypothetical protein